MVQWQPQQQGGFEQLWQSILGSGCLQIEENVWREGGLVCGPAYGLAGVGPSVSPFFCLYGCDLSSQMSQRAVYYVLVNTLTYCGVVVWNRRLMRLVVAYLSTAFSLFALGDGPVPLV